MVDNIKIFCELSIQYIDRKIKLIFLKIPNYILWFDNVCDTISSAENFEIKKVKREVRYEHNKKEWYRGCF